MLEALDEFAKTAGLFENDAGYFISATDGVPIGSEHWGYLKRSLKGINRARVR